MENTDEFSGIARGSVGQDEFPTRVKNKTQLLKMPYYTRQRLRSNQAEIRPKQSEAASDAFEGRDLRLSALICLTYSSFSNEGAGCTLKESQSADIRPKGRPTYP